LLIRWNTYNDTNHYFINSGLYKAVRARTARCRVQSRQCRFVSTRDYAVLSEPPLILSPFGEDSTRIHVDMLMIKWCAIDYTFLVLNLGFHIVDSVAALHLERNCLPRESLYEDLHSV
jgi:hypothetical protein